MPDAGPLPGVDNAPADPGTFRPDSPLTGPAETVARPEPGTLARGAWEAPASAFYVAAAFVVLAALLYAAARTRLLRHRK